MLSTEGFAKLSNFTNFHFPKTDSARSNTLQETCKVSAETCRQRGGGFTQAGASVRLGREQKMMLPALCQTSLHPRLRETAR